MTQPSVVLSKVTATIGKTPILHDISFAAYPGRVHAILGPNGAGKSTTFKTLLGLIPVDSGSVTVFDKPFSKQQLHLFGTSINGPSLYEHLNAAQNLHIHCLLLGLPQSEIHRVLHMVGLAETNRKKIRSFSTGMKARLALGVAMLGSPKILVLDEPQNGLDPEGIADLRAFLRSWASAGRTVIVSSHQLGEVTRLADDITIISAGTTVFSGTAAELTKNDDLETAYLRLSQAGGK